MEPSFSLNLQQYHQDSFFSINDKLIDETGVLVMNYIESNDTSSSLYNSSWSNEQNGSCTNDKNTRPMSYAGILFTYHLNS